MTEGFERPCFKIYQQGNEFLWYDDILEMINDIRISYFPSSENNFSNQNTSLELNDVDTKLILNFSKFLELEDEFYIFIDDDTTSNITDFILHFDVSYRYKQKIDKKDTYELMKELGVKLNKEG